ncbi:MAG TPA: nucleotidyltransferase domain-containing protein [Lachnospiraceae bacterium]|jgi:uncharacterized protein|nr:nucleotidyltransferase domain-containing protein [Lachnospiraceae bacterium]
MCTTNDLEQIIQLIAQIYKEYYGEQLDKIYLYGSYARGDYDAESDIDIVAIVKESREEAEKQLKKVWDESFEIAYDYDVIISPTVIPYEEFEKMKEVLPYYRSIWREGVEISA